MKRRSATNAVSGMTLLELLLAIALVGLLSVGMLFAIRVGLGAMESSQRSMTESRRSLGAQKILELELSSFLPFRAHCGNAGGAQTPLAPFFAGEPGLVRFVSGYSLSGGMRGVPQVVEIFVAAGERGRGVRLLMNEIPWRGPVGAGAFCQPSFGPAAAPAMAAVLPTTFVLADRVAACRFLYREPAAPGQPPMPWLPRWIRRDIWPDAVRVEIVPMTGEGSVKTPPIGTVARLGVTKAVEEPFVY